MEHKNAALFGASVTAAAMVSSAFPWTAAAAGWSLGALLLAVLPQNREKPGRAGAWLILGGSVILLAAILLGADGAFPADSTFPFVSLALLAVLLRAMAGRMGPAVPELLGLGLVAVLAAPVLFGLGDVDWGENAPVTPGWSQVLICLGTTAPWWCLSGTRTRRTWAWYGGAAAVSLGMSLLTRGTLGAALTEEIADPLYRTVQTIRVLGVLQRLEAFLASALLLGSFALLYLAADLTAEALEVLQMRNRKNTALILAGAFALEWLFRAAPASVQAVMETVFWGFLAAYALGIVFCTKFAKKA